MTDREKVIFLAERVMGWRQCRLTSDGKIYFDPGDRGGVVCVFNPAGSPAPISRSWKPLTDPAHSEQTCDKMFDLGWSYSISVGRDLHGDKFVRVTFLRAGAQGNAVGINELETVADAAIAAIEAQG